MGIERMDETAHSDSSASPQGTASLGASTSVVASNTPIWLSVLVPVYNVQAYLRECVESVMQQVGTDAGVEVLLLNDASTDDSGRIAQQLQQQWPQTVRLLQHTHNQGLSAARNTMLDQAVGRYVWFLDSDDCLAPGAVASLKQVVDTQAPDLVLCDFRLWRSKEKWKHRLRGERHRSSFEGPAKRMLHDRAVWLQGLFLSGQMHAWSKIALRTLWQAGGGTHDAPALCFPVGVAFEDMAAMPRLLLRAQSVVYRPEVWVVYRQREGSILASMNARKAMDLGQALHAFSEDYAREVVREPQLATPAVQLAIAHLAARNYMGALRALQRDTTAEAAEQQTQLAQLTQAFQRVSPLTPAQLLQQYAQRGWWARYWRARQPLRALQKDLMHG